MATTPDTYTSLATGLRTKAGDLQVAYNAALVAQTGVPPSTAQQRYDAALANHKQVGGMATNSQKLVNLAQAELTAELKRIGVIDRTGIFVGNAPAEITTFSNWLGHQPKWLLTFCGNKNSPDYTGAGRYQWLLYANYFSGRRIWTVNPFLVDWAQPAYNPATNGNITDWAAGKYRNLHVGIAQEILKYDTSQKIQIRIGHEFNGDWYEWQATSGKHELFKAGFRAQVDAMRSVGASRFEFDWCPNIGAQHLMPDPTLAYPGDDVVDVIGMDVYYTSRWDDPDPLKQWTKHLTQPFGLTWLETFANAHGKPMAITEWGVEPINAGSYVTSFASWLTAPTRNVKYHNYWDANSSVNSKIGGGIRGQTSDAYLAAFK